MTYNTIDQVKAANEQLGHSWFAPETTQYHGSTVVTEIIGGFYFVESSDRTLGEPDSGKIYRAVAASPTGNVEYLSGGDSFDTADEARGYIEKVVAKR